MADIENMIKRGEAGIGFAREAGIIGYDAKNPAHFVGARYMATRGLDARRVAKRIKKDIAALMYNGDIHPATYKVMVDNYPRKPSIIVQATGLMDRVNRFDLQCTLDAVVDQYNYDASEYLTCSEPNERFYSRVDIC